jgi:hypothetical protein
MQQAFDCPSKAVRPRPFIMDDEAGSERMRIYELHALEMLRQFSYYKYTGLPPQGSARDRDISSQICMQGG